jgi:outer membrane protein TolC
VPGFDRTSTQWNAEVGASWEIDFWGRFRRAVEATDAELQASVADYDDVMVLLYAEVASHYISYRTFQDRVHYLRLNEQIQEGAFNVTKSRFDAGEVPERDLFEAQQVLEETRSLIPDAELGARIENNALCVLTGQPPRDLSAELGQGSIPKPPPTVAVGIPPTCCAAVPTCAAPSASRPRAARSSASPSRTTTRASRCSGSLGVAAEHIPDLDKSGADTSFLGMSFTWSILDYGRTASHVAETEADFRAAVLDYQDAVLQAGRETEDALAALFKTQERLVPQAASADAAARTVQIVQGSVRRGRGRLLRGLPVRRQPHDTAGPAGHGPGRRGPGPGRRLPVARRRMGHRRRTRPRTRTRAPRTRPGPTVPAPEPGIDGGSTP